MLKPSPSSDDCSTWVSILIRAAGRRLLNA